MRTGTKKVGGRPPKFDRDEVAGKLEAEFRKRGYAGSSISELAQAAGVNRPTLAASFGDRPQLYRLAAARFAGRMRRAMEVAFASPDLRVALESYLGAVTEIYGAKDGQPSGCLVFSTAPASSDEPAVQEVLRSALDELDSALQSELCRQWGKGPKLALPVRSATLLVAATVHSLAIRARAGDDQEALKPISRALLDALFPGKQQCTARE